VLKADQNPLRERQAVQSLTRSRITIASLLSTLTTAAA
jgi:hypothetical protein